MNIPNLIVVQGEAIVSLPYNVGISTLIHY